MSQIEIDSAPINCDSISNVNEDVLTDQAVLRTREEIFEEVINKIYTDSVKNYDIPFFINCLTMAWRRIGDWIFYPHADDMITLLSCYEAEASPIDSACFGILDVMDETKEPKIYKRSSSCCKLIVQQNGPQVLRTTLTDIAKLKKKKPRKKKRRAGSDEKSPSPGSKLELFTAYIKSAKGTRTNFSRSYTSSVAWGECKDFKKKKYVKQLQHYINPKTFPTRMTQCFVNDHVGLRTINSQTGRLRVNRGINDDDMKIKTNWATVINVREMIPEVIDN